jgi:hypothetical protein
MYKVNKVLYEHYFSSIVTPSQHLKKSIKFIIVINFSYLSHDFVINKCDNADNIN